MARNLSCFVQQKMTILTAGACAFVVSSAGHAVPAAVGTAAGVVMTGVKLWVQAEPVKVAISTAVGAGTSSGAIAGAIASKTAANAFTGALLGGMSAAGVGSVMAGSIAAASGTIASSPLGLLTVGTSHTSENQPTYDCWKLVVRDISVEPSSGITLKDLVYHPHISNVTVTPSESLPQIIIENVWNEKFEIEYVMFQDSDKLHCHASPVSI